MYVIGVILAQKDKYIDSINDYTSIDIRHDENITHWTFAFVCKYSKKQLIKIIYEIMVQKRKQFCKDNFSSCSPRCIHEVTDNSVKLKIIFAYSEYGKCIVSFNKKIFYDLFTNALIANGSKKLHIFQKEFYKYNDITELFHFCHTFDVPNDFNLFDAIKMAKDGHGKDSSEMVESKPILKSDEIDITVFVKNHIEIPNFYNIDITISKNNKFYEKIYENFIKQVCKYLSDISLDEIVGGPMSTYA